MEANRSSRHVDLNVGGTYYTTSLPTLKSYPDSLLGKIFNKTPIPLEKDRKGRYIIDRDGKVFRYILNFLRGGNLNLHANFKEYDQLREEVTYYKLKEMKSLLNEWQTGRNKRTSLEQHNENNDTEGRRKHITGRNKRNSDEQQNENNGTEGRRDDITPELLDLDLDMGDIDYQSDMELFDDGDTPLWFMDTNTHRTPYVPQIGDDIMYFWQGHKYYVEAVKSQSVYDIDGTKFPWERGDLKTEEPMRVVSLEYHTGPPVTCEIKLLSIDKVTKKPAGKTFQFSYHVMPDVKDFMILTQHYEISIKRKWKVGDQFRAAIDNKWCLGVIEDITPMDEEFPKSLFQAFSIRWKNRKSDVLSPWDLEPIESKPGKEAQITNREMQQLRYDPKPGDWGEGDQNTECNRILGCLEQIMSLEVAKTLTTMYCSNDSDESIVVPYPIKVETIRKRLENRFYRRRKALEWEVRQIETNANLFNEPNSKVVKSAEVVTNVLLEVVRNLKVDNAFELYNRMVGTDNIEQATETEGKKRSISVKTVSSSDEESDDETITPLKKRRRRIHDETAWVTECEYLLDKLIALKVSKPFRTPIKESAFKKYADVIEEPMDLSTVKERMSRGDYQDPHEFVKDIRLIVWNSKACFTDKKSEIHNMTLKFSRIFEDNIRGTLMNYKNAAAFKKLSKGNGTPSPVKKGKDRKQDFRETLALHDKPGPSGIKKRSKALKALSYTSSLRANEDEDDSDCETVCSEPAVSDDEWRPSDSSGKDEDDSAAKARDRTSSAKSPKVRLHKLKRSDKSGEMPKQTKRRKSSGSSDDSIFEVDPLNYSP